MNFDGRNPYDIPKAREYLERLISRQSKFRIVAQHPIRTGRQNRFFYAILELICNHTGMDVESLKQLLVKERLCRDLFYKGATMVGKEAFPIWRSTKDLTTKEFSIMIERLYFFSASELGLYIPDPTTYLDVMDSDENIDWSQFDSFIRYAEDVSDKNKEFNATTDDN